MSHQPTIRGLAGLAECLTPAQAGCRLLNQIRGGRLLDQTRVYGSFSMRTDLTLDRNFVNVHMLRSHGLAGDK